MEHDAQRRERIKREVRSWILTLGVPVAVLLLLNAFVLRFAVVKGSSMYPTLHDRDFMIARQIAYTPQPGDRVLASCQLDGAEEIVVKRVIATGGQAVQVDYQRNQVLVDGQVVAEDYINGEEADPMLPLYGLEVEEFTVPEGRVFLLGDNRNHSTDSRGQLGMVPVGSILGKVVLVIPFGVWFGGT